MYRWKSDRSSGGTWIRYIFGSNSRGDATTTCSHSAPHVVWTIRFVARRSESCVSVMMVHVIAWGFAAASPAPSRILDIEPRDSGSGEPDRVPATGAALRARFGDYGDGELQSNDSR